MLQFLVVQILIIVFMYKIMGFKATVFYLAQALFSIQLLELVNYIRHYGLVRKEISPGVYEQCGIQHSWNAP